MLTQYAVMAVFCRADQRRRHIDQMWAPDRRLAVSSLRLTSEEVDDINAHISQVHDDPDRDKGLAFTYDRSHGPDPTPPRPPPQRRSLYVALKATTLTHPGAPGVRDTIVRGCGLDAATH